MGEGEARERERERLRQTDRQTDCIVLDILIFRAALTLLGSASSSFKLIDFGPSLARALVFHDGLLGPSQFPPEYGTMGRDIFFLSLVSNRFSMNSRLSMTNESYCKDVSEN